MEISREELSMLIKTAVKEAMKAHACEFSNEEKQLLKDMALGGKAFKRIVIYLVVGFLLLGIGIKNAPDLVKLVKG